RYAARRAGRVNAPVEGFTRRNRTVLGSRRSYSSGDPTSTSSSRLTTFAGGSNTAILRRARLTPPCSHRLRVGPWFHRPTDKLTLQYASTLTQASLHFFSVRCRNR